MIVEQVTRKSITLGGKEITFESGKMARQADAAILVTCGDTMALVTAMASKREVDRDFFPLTIDVEERMYAAGKIPGGFFKREGRPSEKSILNARLIDRPLRPNFDQSMRIEVQVVATTLSVDQVNPQDVLGLVGASAALTISDIPFDGPVGAVRVGRVNGNLVANPTFQELDDSDLDLVVAGVMDRESGEVHVIMVEAEAKQVPEEELVEALEFARQGIRQMIEVQLEMAAEIGRPKREINLKKPDLGLAQARYPMLPDRVDQTMHKIAEERLLKADRDDRINALRDEMLDVEKDDEDAAEMIRAYNAWFDQLVEESIRNMIVSEGRRVDGRAPDEIRKITAEVGLIPRTHGSGLFTRGQTQVLTLLTLGAISESQTIDDLTLEDTKRYIHHYNFPPFSVGETGVIRGPRRREIGHGALAERALEPVIPDELTFPYAIRMVSEVLSSNGSTSMGSVCGSTLALMDAGVPLKDGKGVGGIAMGLIKKGDKCVVLSDIQGIEDKYGDMDFKVAGTRDGVTALQMDMKVRGIDVSVMREALAQAREGRLYILGKMMEAIEQPRSDVSEFAPRVISMTVPVDKIREVIGSGGKVIHKLVADFDVNIDIEDDGRVFITAKDKDSGMAAKQTIEQIIREAKPGEEFMGKVTRTTTFGAFVEFLPGKEGLVHISKLSDHRIEKVEDVVNVGDALKVKVVEVDRMGRVNLIASDFYTGPIERRDSDRREGPRGPRDDRPRRPRDDRR